MIKSLCLLLMLLSLCPCLAQEPRVAWEVLSSGNGSAAKVGDEVAISYTLRLPSGEIVDATPENTTFKVVIGSPQVIPGLSQGLTGMKRGEMRRLTIPPELGYGQQAVGAIPADSTLLFDVSLMFFVKEARETLAETFGKDGSENRPDANTVNKPAMFEYLIRDFFTRPWRYPDSPRMVWAANLGLTVVAFLLWVAARLADRRRRVAP